MKSFKRTATISKRSPGILLRVPRRCTNGTEEVFHHRFITIEQLAVEVTWVPIDYHTPKIEDCGTIFCHCKYILSFLRESSIMSVSRAKRNLFRSRSPIRGSVIPLNAAQTVWTVRSVSNSGNRPKLDPVYEGT